MAFLKHALDIPHIEDLMEADYVQLSMFCSRFITERLAFEEEHHKTINKLENDLIIWETVW